MTLNGFSKHQNGKACHRAGGKLQDKAESEKNNILPLVFLSYSRLVPGNMHLNRQKPQKYKPPQVRTEVSQKHVPPANLHTFTLWNQKEQTKMTQSFTIYLSFMYFEDKHTIFGTLEEWQSCSWFSLLPIPTISCFLLLLESNSFLSQEGLNTKVKENITNTTWRVPHSSVLQRAQSRSQLPGKKFQVRPFS